VRQEYLSHIISPFVPFRHRYYSHQVAKRVGIFVEDNRRRRTSKCARGARVFCGSQAIDGIAAIVVNFPATDAVAEVFSVADAVVEAWADGGGEGGREEGQGEGGEVHFGCCCWAGELGDVLWEMMRMKDSFP
jgi:hypothetical protein